MSQHSSRFRTALPFALLIGVTPVMAQTTWTKVADEFGVFTLPSGSHAVRYGAGSQWTQQTMSGTQVCANSTFGQDPAPGVGKVCERGGTGGTGGGGSGGDPNQPWTKVADEYGTLSSTTTRTYRFGAPGMNWFMLNLSGTHSCASATFGGDPVPGVAKICEVNGQLQELPPSALAPETKTWPPAISGTKTNLCSTALTGTRTFDVGPGQTYLELTQVPWLSLQAGDVVNIHYRSTPYKTKFSLQARGTAAAPVIINGVTNASCQRPEISGDGAVTAADVAGSGFSSVIQPLGLITIHNSDPALKPRYITIQNLKLTNAHDSKTYFASNGAVTSYARTAAAIYTRAADSLTIENCYITENGQGVFTNTVGQTQGDYSSYVILRRNHITQNGSGYETEHNVYVQGYRSLYEGNYIGPVKGGQGSGIKDRSSGTVMRYNHIVASARAIDLVDTEEESFSIVRSDPLYNTAWLYGNLIVNDTSLPAYSVRPIHWGYDMSAARARAGTLYFYHNTMIMRDPAGLVAAGGPGFFHMGAQATPAPLVVEAFSNILGRVGVAGYIWYLAEDGTMKLRGTNFVPTGIGLAKDPAQGHLDTTGATVLSGNDPLLTAGTYVPNASSYGLDAVTGTGPTTAPTGATLANLQVQSEYVHGTNGWKPRVMTGTKMDLGAFEKP